MLNDFKFKSNTWYFCPADKIYFKYYIETLQHGNVDYIAYLAVNKEIIRRRENLNWLNRLKFHEFIELDEINQETVNLLYEK